jgi:hypothetical protein
LIFWHISLGVAAIHCDFETAEGVAGNLCLDYLGKGRFLGREIRLLDIHV